MPYNPGVQNRSGEIAASGFVAGANTLGRAFERYSEIKEQRAEKAKAERSLGAAAKTIANQIPGFFSNIGMMKEEFLNLPPGEQFAHVEGYAKAQGVREADEKAKANAALPQFVAELTRPSKEGEPFPHSAAKLPPSLPGRGAMIRGLPLGQSQEPRQAAGSFGSALAKHPEAVNAEGFVPMIRGLGASEGSIGGPQSYTDPTTGAVFVYQGKSLLRAGEGGGSGNGPGGLTPVLLPDGTPSGWLDAGNGKLVRDHSAPELPREGWDSDGDGVINISESVMGKALGGKPVPPGPVGPPRAGAPPPAHKETPGSVLDEFRKWKERTKR